eukprot:4304229-Prymnesium_polylepis.1
MMRCADASSMGLVASAHCDYVQSVGFSPDGTRIVSGSNEGVNVWGRQHSLVPCCRMLAVAADVQWAVADGVCVWCVIWRVAVDASNMALVAELSSAHDNYVPSVGFSPDGTRIVSGSAGLGSAGGSVT